MPSSNTITITDQSSTLSSIIYVDNSANVTSGQSYIVPPTITQSGRVFTITFYADRKNSEAVATAFNASSGGTAYEYAASYGGGIPDELNFYFTVQMTFNTAQGDASVPLNLGQGNHSLTNNWWLGGSIVTSSKPSLNIPVGSNNQTLVLPLSGNNDSYTFGPGSIV